jgi:hypothetical protein
MPAKIVAPPVVQPTANEQQVGGSHYNTPIQHWDFVVQNQIPYLEAVAIKYIFRHASKGGKEDLLKAKHFIDKILETFYP